MNIPIQNSFLLALPPRPGDVPGHQKGLAQDFARAQATEHVGRRKSLFHRQHPTSRVRIGFVQPEQVPTSFQGDHPSVFILASNRTVWTEYLQHDLLVSSAEADVGRTAGFRENTPENTVPALGANPAQAVKQFRVDACRADGQVLSVIDDMGFSYLFVGNAEARVVERSLADGVLRTRCPEKFHQSGITQGNIQMVEIAVDGNEIPAMPAPLLGPSETTKNEVRLNVQQIKQVLRCLGIAHAHGIPPHENALDELVIRRRIMVVTITQQPLIHISHLLPTLQRTDIFQLEIVGDNVVNTRTDNRVHLRFLVLTFKYND